MEQQSEQLSLPYKEIKSVMGRKYYRDNFAISSKESYKIPVDKIQVRDGYNKRTVYEEMESLVEWIKLNTEDGIVELDPLPVIEITNENEIFILRGHRRLKGIHIAISEGLKVDYVVCTPAQKDINEFDRAIDIYTSNMHQSKLKPIEQAELVFDVKNNFGKISNEEIGKRLGVSRQTVDNLLLIAEASDDVKNEIKVGNMSFTDAVAFVRTQRKQGKEADKKEKESHETKAKVNNEPEDLLANDVKELAELEQRADEFKEREAEKAARDLERLLDLANEVLVNKDSLTPHIGKRFAAPAYGIWVEEVLDNETGSLVPTEREQLLLGKDQEVNETAIDLLIANNAKSVYIYKVHTAAPSVFTELPETEEKSKFDLDRIEMAQIINCIKLADKLEAIVNKLDVNDGTKTDVANIVKWMQKDLDEVRTWIHNNRKFNKLR